MNRNLAHIVVTSLLSVAGLVLSPAGAQAISPSQASEVRPGMTRAFVLSLLGQPIHQFHFVSQGLTTFTYELPAQAGAGAVLDVDFDASGHVLQASEVVEVTGHRAGR